MRLVRYREEKDGKERIGVAPDSDQLVEIQKAADTGEPLIDFLMDPDHEKRAHSTIKNGLKSRSVKQSAVTILPPIRRPGKIICMGGNFADHLTEGTATSPPFPISFLKAPSALIGHNASIHYPPRIKLLDYEVELATVIGRHCKNVTKEDALDYVAGFSIFDDISARDVQFAEMKRGFCNLGKNFATFAPMGPFLVTPDQAVEPDNMKMELKVNTSTRQLGSTRSMVFKIRELIEFFSQMSLEPGDIITSGTPSGVAIYRKTDREAFMLRPGDVIESEIESLGKLRNIVVEDEPSRVFRTPIVTVPVPR